MERVVRKGRRRRQVRWRLSCVSFRGQSRGACGLLVGLLACGRVEEQRLQPDRPPVDLLVQPRRHTQGKNESGFSVVCGLS